MLIIPSFSSSQHALAVLFSYINDELYMVEIMLYRWDLLRVTNEILLSQVGLGRLKKKIEYKETKMK